MSRPRRRGKCALYFLVFCFYFTAPGAPAKIFWSIWLRDVRLKLQDQRAVTWASFKWVSRVPRRKPWWRG